MERAVPSPIGAAERTSWAARSALVTLAGVSTGAMAHVMMGGARPGVLSLLPAVVFSALLTLGLTKHHTPIRLGLAAGLSQLVFHFLFVLGGSGDLAPHHHGDHLMVSLPASEMGSAWMTLGHVVAAALAALSVSVLSVTLRLFGELRSLLHRMRRWAELGPVVLSGGSPSVIDHVVSWRPATSFSPTAARAPPAFL